MGAPTQARRYFQMPAEPLERYPGEYGPGILYVEFNGEWASRQCELFETGQRLSSRDSAYRLCDQPLSRMNTGDPHIMEITGKEFETASEKARQGVQADTSAG